MIYYDIHTATLKKFPASELFDMEGSLIGISKNIRPREMISTIGKIVHLFYLRPYA